MSIGLGLSVTGRGALGAHTTDAMMRRIDGELGVFADWLTVAGASGIVGEVGWPYDESPTNWNALGSTWLAGATRRSFGAVYFDAGQTHLNYKLAVYQPSSGVGDLAVSKAQATVVSGFTTSGAIKRAVFLIDGAQNTPYQDEATSSFSNANIGTYGTDYLYPSATSLAYIKARGHDTVVLQVRWERLQPTLGAAFNATESTRVQTCVSAAISAGLNVIIQLFNKNAYYLDNAGTGERKYIGSAECTQAHFTDFWTRISTLYKNTAGVIAYALMNEPFSTPQAWEAVAQATVTAIRGIPDTKLLIVPMSQTAGGITKVGHSHPVAFITDSASNFLYEAHHYFDEAQGGEYALTYAQERTNATGARVSDTFTRADAVSLGAAERGGTWVSDQVGVSSNRAYPVTSAGVFAQANIPGGYPYGTLQATFTTIGGDEMYLVRAAYYRGSGSLVTAWQWGAAYGSWVLRRVLNDGTVDVIYTSSGAPAPANGDVPSTVFRNGSVACKVNGTTLHTRTNVDIGWGATVGFAWWQGGTSRLDGFSYTPDYAGG